MLPFTMGQILKAIVKINESSGAAKKEVSSRILKDIIRRQVNFPLTKENEEFLRNEGATVELIEIIRKNSQPLPKPTPIPTPTLIPTPMPIVAGNKVEIEHNEGKFIDYVGQFETPTGLVIFQQEGEKFIGVSPNGERIELLPDAATKDKFTAQTVSVTATFERDAGEKIVGVTIIAPNGRESKGKKIDYDKGSYPKRDLGNLIAGTVRKTTLPGGVEMSFAYVPAGSFEMGSTQSDDEKPIHTVKISQGFWMQTTEVTQAHWKSVMGALPSKCDYGELNGSFLGDNKPIICVNWDDAQEFIKQMNLKNDGYKYRLPSEAEWEYAARSGTTGNYADIWTGWRGMTKIQAVRRTM